MTRQWTAGPVVVLLMMLAFLPWNAPASEKVAKDLIASLEKLSNGDLAPDTFVFSASYPVVPENRNYMIGDVGQVRVSIRGTVATIGKSVVVKVEKTKTGSVPKFTEHSFHIDAGLDDIRSIAGQAASAGPHAGASARLSSAYELSFDATLDGKSGSLKLDLTKPDESNRAQGLIAALKDLVRQAGSGSGKPKAGK